MPQHTPAERKKDPKKATDRTKAVAKAINKSKKKTGHGSRFMVKK